MFGAVGSRQQAAGASLERMLVDCHEDMEAVGKSMTYALHERDATTSNWRNGRRRYGGMLMSNSTISDELL